MKKPEDVRGEAGPLETRSVIFVEHTPDGMLAKRLREQVNRMEHIMGFKLKVVERTGTRLKDMFSPTNVWGEANVNVMTALHVPRSVRTYLIALGGALLMNLFAANAILGLRNEAPFGP